MKAITQKIIPNLWNDEDCIVDEDTSASSSVNIPHQTSRFVNVLIGNKGNVLPEDKHEFANDPPIKKIDTNTVLNPSAFAKKKAESEESVSDFDEDDFCFLNSDGKYSIKPWEKRYSQLVTNKALWES